MKEIEKSRVKEREKLVDINVFDPIHSIQSVNCGWKVVNDLEAETT